MSTVAFNRNGSGEPMLLIHGIGHQRSAWGRVEELLARHYDVIAVDLPGFGESPLPISPHSCTVASYGDQLLELLEFLGLETPHVVGNSLGGLIALDLATRGKVASATALSPAGFINRLELLWVGANLLGIKAASHTPYRVVKTFADRVPLRRISMRSLYLHPELLTAEQALADTLNLRNSKAFWPVFVRGGATQAFAGEPTVPTTIAWGDRDRLLLPREAWRARRQLPDVRHVWLRGCGHVPMLDEPELVADVVRETAAEAHARDTNLAV